jgi:formate/nitrite transporter FocA (FNT family)
VTAAPTSPRGAGQHVVQRIQGDEGGGREKGVAKAKLSWDKAIVAGFLAGAYIAFGALLATVTTAGMRVEL